MVELSTDISEVEILNQLDKAIQQNSVIVVLDKDEVKVLKSMIKDREAFGRVFSWFLYLAGAVVTLAAGWSILTNFKWIK